MTPDAKKTMAANILVPVITAASIAAFLWLHPAPAPEPVKAPAPPPSTRDRLWGPEHARDWEWDRLMRCIDQPVCEARVDAYRAGQRKRELDRLRMRPLDPTGNRVKPRPSWDWKQT